MWSDDMKVLFTSLKQDLTTSPVMARYDSTKPLFLKTDWSALGMIFILMQPCDDAASRKATEHLLKTGECLFELGADGPRLQPFLSGFRICTESESHYHSFVGEIAALRWAISRLKVYLWGQKFWSLCDMATLYKILDYDGPIHILRRWCQELQAYNMLTLHRSAKFMIDVDALN